MSLEFTLVRRAISLAVIDGPDTGDNPDILKAQGSVLFEPVIKKGDSIQVQTRGGSETYALAPIECPINDGIISHRGQDGVKLPAGGEAANPSLIRWKATFSRMQAGGKSFTLAPVIFDAVPGGEIDLTMVAPVAGAPEGVVRGPRGTSLESIIVDGSELVFTAVDDAGSFEIARIPLDDMVRAEADAAAAAAVDGVETVLAATVDAANAARDDAKGHADRAEEASGTVAGEVYDQLSGLVVQAEGAATTATGAAGDASQSKQDAVQAASDADGFRAAAGVHAGTAAQDATRAETARTEAVQAQVGAETAEVNADAHRQAAAMSETNAATHETNAGASATAAASSATEAKDHADRAEQMADPTGLRNEVMQQLADLVDGAPEDLDTIREGAEYAQANRDITDQLNAAIGAKADKSHTHAWSAIAGKPDIPVTDVGYRIRWADHVPNLYPAGVSVSMSATEQGWGAALAAGNPDYVDDGFVVILTIRNGRYDQSAIQMVYSYTNVARPVYIRKYNGEAAGWSNFRKLSDDGHKHDIADINGAASKDYVDSRPALFSGSGAPPSSIPGATVGDWWLDTSTMELHKITGV